MKRAALFLAVFFAAPAWSAVTIGLAYDEPATSEDGSALTDLSYTNVHWFDPVQNAEVIVATRTATRPQGNGSIEIDVPFREYQSRDITADVWATAVDAAGNRSGRSNVIQINIDRLPPGRVQ